MEKDRLDFVLVPVGLLAWPTAACSLSCLASIYHSQASYKNCHRLKCRVSSQMGFLHDSNRYYAHVSFLVTVPSSSDNMESVEYVARNLNRASYFWSLGLRAFYLSFPLLLWIYGPVPVFLCCFMMSFVLYFLDTASSSTHQLHRRSFKEETLKAGDLESIDRSSAVSFVPSENISFEEFNLHCPLLDAGPNSSRISNRH
ncbi:hypothetical protein DITRI_Ditri04bG0193600 [Diplodiscus trichospermus]